MARFHYFKLKQNDISDNILNLLFNFSRCRKQRIVLKRQASDVGVWVPHGSTFVPLLFLLYTNDLASDLSNAKLLADDTSLFCVVHNVNTSAGEVDKDLLKIDKWAYQWKMSFNPDPIKQSQKD